MGCWVDRLQGLGPVAQFEMQMGTRSGTGHAHGTELGSLLNPLSFANKRLLQMGVEGFNAFSVVEQHGVAIATHRLHQRHAASLGRQHRGARGGRQIHARMHAPGGLGFGVAPTPGIHGIGPLAQGIGQLERRIGLGQ